MSEKPTAEQLQASYEAPFTPQPLTAYLLLDSLPQTGTITDLLESTHITEELGIETTGSVEDQLILSFATFGTRVVVDFDEAQFPELEKTLVSDFVLHNELAEMKTHRYVATVTATPGPLADDDDPREAAKQLELIEAFALQILAEVPQVIGLHYVPAQATFGRNFIQNFVLGSNNPDDQWYPVEHQVTVRTTEPTALGTRSAYTVGLAATGHPELQVENSALSHDELFTVLMNAAGYALTQGSFTPGQEIAKGAATSQIQLVSWIPDPQQPALLFQF